MSAKPEFFTIEINGVPLKARPGAMIIEVADEAGIHIPRFCYHKKLPVAANCRMCLVEAEKVPKPLPACATPVSDGMKVFTRSAKAIAAQRAVMEFLLINHPLDCPICDQGGECELQDLAMGYGRGVSRFTEGKRVVVDKNIGPLISTDMTRCIHCTRCVRFLDDIAGYKELGAMGRGNRTEIGTYVEQSVGSELSGNVIDLCPVGALTAKPSRYTARAWELVQHACVAPHDSVGSNVYVHTRRGRVMRAVPRENEAINETWLSDRDRFSYQGLYSDDRLPTPLIKQGDTWREANWDDALQQSVMSLKTVIEQHGADQVGVLVSPTATLEELYLAQKLARGLGCTHIDHRLRQADFSDQALAPVYPGLGQAIQDLERMDAALLVGSNVRKDQPIIGHRLRKAALKGAALMAVNPVDYEFHFPLAAKGIVSPAGMAKALAGVAKALADSGDVTLPAAVARLVAGVEASEEERAIAERLKAAQTATVLLGNLAAAQPDFAVLRALAGVIAQASGAVFGYLPEAANTAGAWLAGAVPHRGPAGQALEQPGMTARDMFESPRKAYVLIGTEPELDSWDSAAALKALRSAEFVVGLTAYQGEGMRDYAQVMLPIALFAETSGTFVNAEGRWQSFKGATSPLGEARPAWKVLRVLGNLFELDGFEYLSSEEVRDELAGQAAGVEPDNRIEDLAGEGALAAADGLYRIGEVPIYSADPLVRRAAALQKTDDAMVAAVFLCKAEAQRLGLKEGDPAAVSQGGKSFTLPVTIDDAVPEGCVRIPAAIPETVGLGPSFGPVTIAKA